MENSNKVLRAVLVLKDKSLLRLKGTLEYIKSVRDSEDNSEHLVIDKSSAEDDAVFIGMENYIKEVYYKKVQPCKATND